MILHLVDDEKIINRTITLFEKANPSANKYLLEIPNREHKLKFVQPSKDVTCAVFNSIEYKEATGDIEKYEAVIIHNLTINKCRLIDEIKVKNIPIIWILWGADLYDYLATKGYKLYLWKPSLLKFKIRWLFFDKLTTTIRNARAQLQGEKNFQYLYEKAYERIDYCCIFNKGDYDLLKKHSNTTAEWQWFNYYPVDFILGKELMDKEVLGEDIILGNSGSITNNHIPAYKLLSTFDLKNKKVITPLSYGDKYYRSFLVKKGYKYLGKNFSPVTEFMPLHEYNKLLCSGRIIIMFNLRQEAVGNILVSLYLGAKVYLNEENNLYEYFSSIGIKVFSINRELTPNNPKALLGLSKDEQIRNRKVILREFNEERILFETKLMIKSIIK